MRSENEIQEFLISLDTADSEFVNALISTHGNFRVVLKVNTDAVYSSTGMIKIPTGIITTNDVVRALEVMSITSNDRVAMHATTRLNFVVDGGLQTELIPIGLPA